MSFARVSVSTPPRSSRSQASIQRVDLPMLQTNKTPKRNVQAKLGQMEGKLQSGKLDPQSKIVLQRTTECTGVHVYCKGINGKPGGPGSRGVCALCKALMHDYCLVCKRWLCATPSKEAASLPEWKHTIVLSSGEGKPIHFQNTCFYHMHGEAIDKSTRKMNQQLLLLK